MRSKIISTVLLALSALSSGCAMCDNPYDYCGPVVDSGDYHPQGYVANSPEMIDESQGEMIEGEAVPDAAAAEEQAE